MNRDLTNHNSIPPYSIPFRATRRAARMLVMVLAAAASRAEQRRKHSEPTVVVIWDSAALQAARDTHLGPPMASIPIRLDSQSTGAHIFVQFLGVQ